MFSRIGPQALPGTAFQGIIPEIPQQKKPLILAMNTRFLFPSHLSHPLASCVPILGTGTLTRTAFELAGGIKTTRSNCAFSLFRGFLPRRVLRCGFPIWQPNGWLGFCTSGPVTRCLLSHSALEGIISISEVLGTFQDSTYWIKFYLNKSLL